MIGLLNKLLRKFLKKRQINIIPVIFIAIILVFLSYSFFITETEKKTQVFFKEMTPIWELSSTKYYYSNVISFKESKMFKDLDIPFTQKSFLLKYNGEVKSGINLKDIEILKISKNQIKISVPSSKILSHYIDDKNIYVYDEKSAIFNKLSINDAFKQINKEKENVEKQIKTTDFLQKSDKNIKTFFEGVLKSMGYEKIEILIKQR